MVLRLRLSNRIRLLRSEQQQLEPFSYSLSSPLIGVYMMPHGVDLKNQEVAGRGVRVSFCVVLRKPESRDALDGALLRGTATAFQRGRPGHHLIVQLEGCPGITEERKGRVW
jgi:hypothetical protein